MAGRRVVVTGGGRGIGAAISRAFLDAGDEVVVLSRTPPEGSLAREVRAIRADVRRPSEVRGAIDDLAGSGPIHVLVNNAGSSRWRALDEVDEAFWDEMIDTNLKSVLFASQAAARHIPSGGAIVNVSSLAGKRGSANNAVYCAAKFGVTGITQALAKELGPRGIRVNAVCPVYVRTAGLEAALGEPAAPPRGGDVDAYLAEFARTQSALGRLPTADEVGRACVFLASSAASAITGQSVNVDCGVLPQ
jgi:3-oxoacyl-[acyl-carrier protein] reductase/meso-butanediol dehydrogenase/(S,S)-butanediol dehydrogenase/diacetyl reductase